MEKLRDKIIPGRRVIVEIEKVKQGMIHVPDDALKREQDKITQGIFVKSGSLAFDDMINTSLPIEEQIPAPGDKVYFVKYAGKALTVEDKEYRVICDEDIYMFEKQGESQ